MCNRMSELYVQGSYVTVQCKGPRAPGSGFYGMSNGWNNELHERGNKLSGRDKNQCSGAVKNMGGVH